MDSPHFSHRHYFFLGAAEGLEEVVKLSRTCSVLRLYVKALALC
jgi:hypothetical protein